MDIQQLLQGMAERLSADASVKNVYGEPVVVGNRTIIPAARIRYGFGGRGGIGKGNDAAQNGGGGGRVSAQPCGAIEITPEGTRFITFQSGSKVAIAFALGFLLGGALLALTGKAADRV